MSLLDLDQARRFLAVLHGEENPLVCWQLFADRAADKQDPERARALTALRHLRAEAGLAWAAERNAAGAGVFCCVNETDGEHRTISGIRSLRALFIDVDGTRELPLSMAQWPLAPSIIVQRDATHWHAYWLLQAGEPLDAFRAAQLQMAVWWGSDPAVQDLPRVMRVPGFAHCKGDPVAVRLVYAGAERFSLAQVLDAHPVPDWQWAQQPEAVRRAAGKQAAAAPAAKPAATSWATPRAPAMSDQYRRVLDAMRKWMLCMDTREGAANPRGGRDKAAYILAREALGRGLTRADVEGLVGEYFARCGTTEFGTADIERIVGSAERRGGAESRNPLAIQQPGFEGGGRARHARMAAPPADGEDVFGDPGAVAVAAPPAPPAPPAEPPHGGGGGEGDAGGEDPERQRLPLAAYDGLDANAIRMSWVICPAGVWPILKTKDGDFKPAPNSRVSDRPIWPVQEGVDVATGESHWLVRWETPTGARRAEWLTEIDLKTGPALVALPGGPVAKKRCEGAAVWLTAALSAVTNPPVKVTSRVGWCGAGEARRWVWPGAEADVKYIREDLGEAGSLEAWREGLDHLLTLEGDAGWTALVALGLSVGAPFVRLAISPNGRRPVLGLVRDSSSGKGSALGYAVSVWGPTDAFTLPASSTAKGLEDRAQRFPDSPIWLDELQQLHERDPAIAATAIYYLGNGQRRVTSSKTQEATGGELRYGVGFYAAEAPVLVGQNQGVLVRCFELTGSPCPDGETARILQRAAREGGALAGPIAQFLAETPVDELKQQLEAEAARWQRPEFRTGEPTVLAILAAGLRLLETLLDVSIPRDQVLAWLAAQVSEQRTRSVDRETQALNALLDQVLNGHWKDDGVSEGREGALIATRKVDEDGVYERSPDNPEAEVKRLVVLALDVNPAYPDVRRLMSDYGGEERLLGAWARRGWITTDGRHRKVKKWHKGQPIGRVVRFSAAGLQAYFDHDPALQETKA